MTAERAIAYFKAQHRFCRCDATGKCKKCTAGEWAISALEKQMPKKPIEIINDNECKIGARIIPKGVVAQKCPICDSFISRSCNYCQNCGQALDWSEENE